MFVRPARQESTSAFCLPRFGAYMITDIERRLRARESIAAGTNGPDQVRLAKQLPAGGANRRGTRPDAVGQRRRPTLWHSTLREFLPLRRPGVDTANHR